MMSEAEAGQIQNQQNLARNNQKGSEFSSGTKIEVIVADSLVKAIVNDILNILREASFASGKIFVCDIMEAYDIETKETGEAALQIFF